MSAIFGFTFDIGRMTEVLTPDIYRAHCAYFTSPSTPAVLKNVIPLIGPLYISLNARECVLLIFLEIFADLYKFIVGEEAKLAKKQKRSCLGGTVNGAFHS